MTSEHVRRARRNTRVLVATAAVVGLLLLYPTSTNRTGGLRRPGQALAPSGVIGTPSAAGLTINGASVDTRYGPVQVQLRIRLHRVVQATAIDYPRGSGTDRDINGRAVPQLEHEAVTAQSARIDTVSGATYTSNGYRSSLQSALDLAHL